MDRQETGVWNTCALPMSWLEVQLSYFYGPRAWALYDIFLPLYYSCSVIFMLIGFHLVQQTFSVYYVPRKVIVVLLLREHDLMFYIFSVLP